MKKLEGKVAIVTGGAMGNGLGIVKVFLEYGASVAIFDYADCLDDTVAQLKEKYPSSLISGYQVDIRDYKRVEASVGEVADNYHHIDILVNTKAVVPYMKENKESSIVNLSSVTGMMVADSGEVAYATTKAALVGFTKSLAVELVDSHIRVNAILPGYILTPMVEGMSKETNPENPETVIQGIASAIPMKRLGTIEELGELAAFLASRESSYITGHEFVIDGGSTLPETTSVGV